MAERSPVVRAAFSRALAGLVVAGTAIAIAIGAVIAIAAEVSLQERLAAASPERGRDVFRVCSACHSVAEGAAHAVGPNLWGVVGRAVASAEGYSRYTPAMTSFGGVWSPARLDRYLRRPTVEIEGTTMIFPGVSNDFDRADLIAWLNLNSPDPMAFGTMQTFAGDDTDAGRSRDAPLPVPRPARAVNLGVLVAGEGAAETYAYCAVCHSERIVAQQGLTRHDWEELLEQMVEENGMTPIEEPDRDRVLSYLTAQYGPDRPNFPTR